MQRLRYVLEMPIISADTGEYFGEVEDVLLDIDKYIIYGVIAKNNENKEYGFYYEDIINFGNDAVIIKKLNELTFETKSLLIGKQSLKGLCSKEIITEFGFNLGYVSDIYFDKVTGEIKGYQISEGLLHDLLYGRKIMPIPQHQVIHDDRIIIQEKANELIEFETNSGR